MGFTIQQDQAKVKSAFRFQMKAELQEVGLIDCSAAIAEAPDRVEAQLRLSLQIDPAVLSIQEAKARFSVRLTIFGDTKDTEPPGGKHLLEIACRYALVYSLASGYELVREDLDAFKEANLVFHCWPYFREFVQNLTMRMGLRIPPLPMLRLAPRPENKPPVKRSAKSTRRRVAATPQSKAE